MLGPLLPHEPRQGTPLDASWGSQVIRYLRAITPRSSRTVQPSILPGGTTYHAHGGGRPSSSPEPDHPWKPYTPPWTGEGDAPEDWGLRVKLIPGTVGNRLASNWQEVLTLGANAEGRWVYLELAINQMGRVMSYVIAEAAVPPTAAAPTIEGGLPETIYVPLFAYDSVNVRVTQFYIAVKTNLKVTVNLNNFYCGSASRSIVVEVA